MPLLLVWACESGGGYLFQHPAVFQLSAYFFPKDYTDCVTVYHTDWHVYDNTGAVFNGYCRNTILFAIAGTMSVSAGTILLCVEKRGSTL